MTGNPPANRSRTHPSATQADQTWNRDHREVLEAVNRHALQWLGSLSDRPVAAPETVTEVLAAFTEDLPRGATTPSEVIDILARRAEPGLTAFGSGRFFGFVIGGTHPAALGADLLASVWDQNAGLRRVTPSAAVVEEVAGGWLKDVLGLPSTASVGFVTGGNMATYAGLAAARHHVLLQHGWDVEELGLQGAPTIRVIASRERHATIDTSLRYLGLGAGQTELVETDDQGRIDVSALQRRLDNASGPTIVALAAGNVNTGAFDDFRTAIPLCRSRGAWVHIDGAFGLWAAASPQTRHLTGGAELADSWSTDAHKWLNVPYDSGVVFVAHPQSHRDAFRVGASYLVQDQQDPDPMDFVPEFSRRARGFAVWAAMRSLGRDGIAELGDRLCAGAETIANLLSEVPGCSVINQVVLNQVLVRCDDDDEVTRRTVQGVVDSGVAYVGPSTFRGRSCMRISVCNGWTNDTDLAATVAAIKSALGKARHRHSLPRETT